MQSLRHMVLAAGVVLGAVQAPAVRAQVGLADPIRVELFASYTETTGSGLSFAQPAGELAVSEIDFGTAGPAWWPLGEALSFGARLTAGLQADAAGNYTVTMGSDDASYLFINGQLVLSLPGLRSYSTAQAVLPLSAGIHAMELQFFNGPCCGSALTLDVAGLTYVQAVPEPQTALLWLAGLLATGWALQRQHARR